MKPSHAFTFGREFWPAVSTSAWTIRSREPACLSPFHYPGCLWRAFAKRPTFLTGPPIDRAKQLLARDECPVHEVWLAVDTTAGVVQFAISFRGWPLAVGVPPVRARFPVPQLLPIASFPLLPALVWVPGLLVAKQQDSRSPD